MYIYICLSLLRLFAIYFFLFLSTLHSVYTRDCSCMHMIIMNITCTCRYWYLTPHEHYMILPALGISAGSVTESVPHLDIAVQNPPNIFILDRCRASMGEA